MLGSHGLAFGLFLWLLYFCPSFHYQLAIAYSFLVVSSYLFSRYRSRKYHKLPQPTKGVVALVTGGSSGIGRAIANELAEKGFDLVLVALEEADLHETKKEIESRFKGKRRVFTILKDLSIEAASQEVYDEVRALKLEVVVLVNAAGYGSNGWFVESSLENYCKMIRLNDIACVRLTSLFAPHMVKRKEGDILFISSITGSSPVPLQAIYGASKSFITAFSLALHHELEPHGVKVTCLMPGATSSGFATRSNCSSALVFHLPLGLGVTSSAEVARMGVAAMDGSWLVDSSTGAIVVGVLNWFYAFVMAHVVPPKLTIAAAQLAFTPKEMLLGKK